VELDDRITIATPEGIELQLQLAGLGSRFIAGLVDLIIQVLAIIVLALATGPLTGGGKLNAVVFVVGTFVIWFFYPILFEVPARGRTPGKRLSHLRVVREGGAPVDLQASAIRNLMRLIDGPLLAYLPTLVGIVVTDRNQRPGDLAAGTLVIRENPAPKAASRARRAKRAKRAKRASAAAISAPLPEVLPDWDVSAITPQELAAVRRFLDRRETLDRAARYELALRLASGLHAKVAGATGRTDPERFLETLAAIKSGRR
jgi:uncharacterized RDD family membrane protein YckC